MISIIEAIQNQQNTDDEEEPKMTWKDRLQKWATIGTTLAGLGAGGYLLHNRLKQNAANYEPQLAAAQSEYDKISKNAKEFDPNNIYQEKYNKSKSAYESGKMSEQDYINAKTQHELQNRRLTAAEARKEELEALKQNKPIYTHAKEVWTNMFSK